MEGQRETATCGAPFGPARIRQAEEGTKKIEKKTLSTEGWYSTWYTVHPRLAAGSLTAWYSAAGSGDKESSSEGSRKSDKGRKKNRKWRMSLSCSAHAGGPPRGVSTQRRLRVSTTVHDIGWLFQGRVMPKDQRSPRT